MSPPAHPKIWFGLCLVPNLLAGAAEIDLAKLPPAVDRKIDFQRDVQPILEENCQRCHGPERPKSQFRLTDRAQALKGGANGVDIVPGKSAESPLIHYVARLVPDLEMPPDGKGNPLSNDQIAVLRAWIDQGVAWTNVNDQAQLASSLTVSPMIGGTVVNGNKSKYRELEWQPDGWNGGVEQFNLNQQWADGRSIVAEGHVSRDDYKLTLDLKKPELGFGRLGFEQFRKFFNDGGGYYGGFTPAFYESGQDLHLDVGRAWLEVGLTLPNWPRIVVGYEHQYKDGMKSMLSWGPVSAPSGNFLDTRSIYPSFAEIHENTHIFRLEVSYDTHGFELRDNLQAEIHDSNVRRVDALNVPVGGTAPDLLTVLRESNRSTQIANTARIQKELYEWWLAGAGYRYSWYDGDSSVNLSPRDGNGQPAAGSIWSADKILLNEVWQVANATSQFQPHKNLTATLGLQGEWKRQEAFGDANLDELIDPSDPTSGIFRFPATELAVMNQTTAEESVVVRYTGLPFTALFAETRLKQEGYDRKANQQGGPLPFQLDADANVRWQDFLVGFNSSPWSKISFGGHYRHRDRRTDYDYGFVETAGAYPGFINARSIIADEVEARITVRPESWITTTFTYRWGGSDFHTTTGATDPNQVGSDSTPGGEVLAGRYQTHTISANATVTPWRRMFLSGTISYQNNRTTTADNGNLSVAPYQGDLWSFWSSATYALDQATDLFGSYYFSRARYGQDNRASGLPLGIDYDRHGVQVGLRHIFHRSITGRLQYAYFSYNEPSSGHLVDFTAHQILGTVNLRW